MGEVKKPDVAWVVIGRRDSELQQKQQFELAAAMVGGRLGEAVQSAVQSVHLGVVEGAMPDARDD